MKSPLFLLFMTGCAQLEYPSMYSVSDKAPSLTWNAIANLDHMGPTIIDGGVNFAVYSENADRVELLLFEDPESDLPTKQYELVKSGDVWNGFVEGVGVGQHYGYIAWGPNWPYDP